MIAHVLALSLLAQAAEPKDPGLITLDQQPLNVRVTKGGEPAPGAGCWMDETDCLTAAKHRADLEAQNATLMKKLEDRKAFPWAPVVIAVLAGATAGYFIHAAAFPNNPAAPPN